MIRPGIRRLFRLAVRRRDLEARETEDEIALHLSLRTEQLIQQGLTPEAAHAEAIRRFGSAATLQGLRRRANRKERTMRFRESIEGLWQDIRYAARGFGREPVFVGFIVLTMALGIGANAAMYGVVDRLLLRGPAEVRDPGRVMRFLFRARSPRYGEVSWSTLPYAAYDAIREATRSFEGVAAYTVSTGTLVGAGADAELMPAGWVTAGFFPLLGAKPVLGRVFTPAEDQVADPQRVALLGYGLWQRRFGGDPGVIGRTVTVNESAYRILGVMPRGFTGVGLSRVDLWMPITSRGGFPRAKWKWNTSSFRVIGRLRPGASPEIGNAEATRVFRAAYDGPEMWMHSADVFLAPVSADERGQEPVEAAVLRWLVGVSLAVLLIACSNVSNLLLARAIRRRGEIAVRLAMGAGRSRLARLFLTEGVLLALMGGLAGLAVAWIMGTLLRATVAPDIEWASSLLNIRVLGALLLVAIVSGLVVGLIPAVQASRPDLTAMLKSGAREGKGQRSRVRALLTVSQAALSMLLLVGAGLFVRSLARVYGLDLGLQPDRVLSVDVRWPTGKELADSAARHAEQNRQAAYYRDALAALQRLPGVAHASFGIASPLSSSVTVSLAVPGLDSIPALPGGGPFVSSISSDYFGTVGTPLLRGRPFTAADREGSARVAIVSRTMAATLWPGRDALGQCLLVGDSKPSCTMVVGIAGDVHRFGLHEPPSMAYYIPVGQETNFSGTGMLVRPTGRPETIIPLIKATLRALDPSLTYIDIGSMHDALDPQIRPWRLGATIFALCGVLALIVAAIGLYSVMSYLVASRTHELGVRAALGASGAAIVRLVVRGGLTMAVAGVSAGAVLAIAAGRWLQPLLFETSARDPLVLGGVATLLLVVAFAACLAPALRARRVTPMTALRSD